MHWLYLCIDLDDPVTEEICVSLEQNRKEIEEALLVLASRSDEHHRRLDEEDTIRKPVTSYEVGSDMISFFDCFCDKSNPGNDGCAKKILLFAESVTKAVSEKAETIGENPAEVLLKVRRVMIDLALEEVHSFFSLCCLLFLSKAQSSLNKHTSHLRQSGPIDPQSPEVYSSIERAMSEIQEGKCSPPGVQRNPYTNALSLCL